MNPILKDKKNDMIRRGSAHHSNEGGMGMMPPTDIPFFDPQREEEYRRVVKSYKPEENPTYRPLANNKIFESTYDNQKTIKLGDKGLHIAELKQHLQNLGDNLNNTSDEFGENLHAFIWDIQFQQHIHADGKIGPQTLRAIDQSGPQKECSTEPKKLPELGTCPVAIPGSKEPQNGQIIECPPTRDRPTKFDVPQDKDYKRFLTFFYDRGTIGMGLEPFQDQYGNNISLPNCRWEGEFGWDYTGIKQRCETISFETNPDALVGFKIAGPNSGFELGGGLSQGLIGKGTLGASIIDAELRAGNFSDKDRYDNSSTIGLGLGLSVGGEAQLFVDTDGDGASESGFTALIGPAKMGNSSESTPGFNPLTGTLYDWMYD